ncbi:uncharacterized protein [Coffea arabica]|uniref:SWIM-type domain-containing protein n=1 Tax=Coffea arabica TaxID=13443 RepID=A0ABM4VA16_COFAR
MRCYIWGKCINGPDAHYEGGEICVFDYVEVTGISLFEMDRMLENEARVYGDKRYHILVEEYGFRRLWHDKELYAYCADYLDYGRRVDLYIEVSFAEILRLQMGYDYEEDDYDDDYVLEGGINGESEEHNGCNSDASSGEFSGKDSDYEMEEEDDDDYEDNVDQNVEWLGIENQVEEERKMIAKGKMIAAAQRDIGSDSESDVDNSDVDAAPDSESDFESLHGSGDEQCRKPPMFNPKDMHNPKIKLKQYFSNFKEFKEAVRTWNIKRGRPFKFVKHDKVKVMAKCPREGCDWYIYARKLSGEGSVQVRTFQKKHKCGFSYHNESVRSSWVAKNYCETVRENPRLDLKSFTNKVMKENKCFLSKYQGYRAKRAATKIVQGDETDHYKKLPDYINEIKRSNPGTTVIMKVVDGYCDAVTRQQKFQRLYMCFSGVKQGFLAACRPIFGLDGTFLKGPAGGVLLTAVGVDPNNGFYPIAYAATEGETKDSWMWFLTLLREDLQIERDYEWTIMSDKQKGIIQACEAVFPNCDHRFCVKHLHSNFSVAGFKGTTLRRALWKAAKATTLAKFSTKMRELAEIDIEAAKWLGTKQPIEWTRSHFRTFSKCDMLLNNICESFNSKILHAREEHIVGLMESLRHYVMTRLQQNRDMAKSKWKKLKFCPRIMKRVKKNMDMATQCFPIKSNDDDYEVGCPYGETYCVNIKERMCTCRKWDLTGIPCSHAISAIWIARKDPMDFIDQCYSVEAYLKCYANCILPVNGEHDWTHTHVTPPLPPTYGRAPGRPKKLRKKGEDEIQQKKEKGNKMSRVGQVIKCNYCGEKGHNKRSCNIRKEQLENAATEGTQATHSASQQVGSCTELFEISLNEASSQTGADTTVDNQCVNTCSGPAKTIARKGAKRTSVLSLENIVLPNQRKTKAQRSQRQNMASTEDIISSAPTPELNLHQVSNIPLPQMPYMSQPDPVQVPNFHIRDTKSCTITNITGGQSAGGSSNG